MTTTKAPVRCSTYPSGQKVQRIAYSMFRGLGPSDAEGNTPEDYEQELHLRACELLFQNRNLPMKFVYKSLWNHGRNLRKHSRRVANKRSYADIDEPSYEMEKDLENRSCLRVLEKALSPEQMATLTFASMHKSGEAREEFGLSYRGWLNRLYRARDAARVVLEEGAPS